MTGKFHIRLIKIALIVLLSGCAHLQSYQVVHFSPQTFETLISEERFQAALDYLEKHSSETDTIEKEARRQQVLVLIDRYENSITHEVTTQIELDNLLRAQEILRIALAKIPSSQKLQKLKTKTDMIRDKRITETSRTLLLSEADYLLSQVELYGEKARLAKPSLMTQWQISMMEHSLAALHGNLLQCGRKALSSSQYDIADKCLQMARKINDSSEVSELLAAIPLQAEEEVLPTITKQYKVLVAKDSNKEPQQLKAEISNALKDGKIAVAGNKLHTLQEMVGNSSDVHALLASLETKKNSRTSELLDKGLILYTNGKISEAKRIWSKILDYDADNLQVKNHINRADKVLQRLRELQTLQDAQQLPGR